MNSKKVIAIFRLGNVQAAMEFAGEGAMQRPVVRLAKLVPADVLEEDPDAAKCWEMEELVALADMIGEMKNQAYSMQTLVPQGPIKPQEPEACANCHTTEEHPCNYEDADGNAYTCEIYRTKKPEPAQ